MEDYILTLGIYICCISIKTLYQFKVIIPISLFGTQLCERLYSHLTPAAAWAASAPGTAADMHPLGWLGVRVGAYERMARPRVCVAHTGGAQMICIIK